MQSDNKTIRSVADAAAKIMAGVQPEAQTEQLQEGWDDMLKSVKDKQGPQPSGGSGVKQGTRYGGGRQKDEPEAEEKPKAKKKAKGAFSEMVNLYQENGLKSLEEAWGKKKKVMKEEPDNEQYTAELEKQKKKAAGTASEEDKAKVAAPASQGVVEVKEETETVEEELKGNQHKIDKNKNNKIDAEDFKLLRKEEEVQEGVTDTLKKVAKKVGQVLGGPDDEGHRKDLQRKMGVPQTGKPSMAKQNEEVESLEEGKMDKMSLSHLWHAHAKHTYWADQGYGAGSDNPKHAHHAATAIENHVRKHHGNKVADDMVSHSENHVAHAEYVGGKEAKKVEDDAAKLRAKHGIKGNLYGMHNESVNEGWDDMVKAAKDSVKSGPKPSGGSGVKLGTRYGGGKQKDKPEQDEKKETKESVELDERSLTSTEKSEMEKNVKGMKKNFAGFRARYGDRAKEVMYATATKQAKGE